LYVVALCEGERGREEERERERERDREREMEREEVREREREGGRGREGCSVSLPDCVLACLRLHGRAYMCI
jgi:hypothetical protein